MVSRRIRSSGTQPTKAPTAALVHGLDLFPVADKLVVWAGEKRWGLGVLCVRGEDYARRFSETRWPSRNSPTKSMGVSRWPAWGRAGGVDV